MGKKVGLPDFVSERGGWGGNGRQQVLSALGKNFRLSLAEKISSLREFGLDQIGRICRNYEYYFCAKAVIQNLQIPILNFVVKKTEG